MRWRLNEDIEGVCQGVSEKTAVTDLSLSDSEK